MSRIAYLDCFSGVSGDMLIGSLLDAGLEPAALQDELAKLALPGYEVQVEKTSRQGLAATKFDVLDHDRSTYRHLADLNRIVEQSALAEGVKTAAKNVFRRIAVAEARIHGTALEKVHFHEVGAVDTIIDVVGTIAGLRLLGIEKVSCSRLNTGTGFIEFSHGKYPVPAPATLEILQGVPIYSTGLRAELVTPTGAAIVRELSGEFGDMPPMRVEQVGYGAGSRELAQPNVLRVVIGEEIAATDFDRDHVAIIETNIDDMNPQIYETVFESLFQHGALDVYLTSLIMKKSRPGVKLSVLCNAGDEEKLAKVILAQTTTIGVRIRKEQRLKLHREIRVVETEFGPVPFKVGSLGDEILHTAPEYEACRKIARETGTPIKDIYERLAFLDIA